VRFLGDMGVSVRVVQWLRNRGYDAVHMRQGGHQRSPDARMFENARTEDRAVLTFDFHFGEILSLTKGASTSIILFHLRDTRAANVIERLDRVLQRSAGELAKGAIIVVEDGRYRVRNLPLGS